MELSHLEKKLTMPKKTRIFHPILVKLPIKEKTKDNDVAKILFVRPIYLIIINFMECFAYKSKISGGICS